MYWHRRIDVVARAPQNDLGSFELEDTRYILCIDILQWSAVVKYFIDMGIGTSNDEKDEEEEEEEEKK